jgi:hypothetical protein
MSARSLISRGLRFVLPSLRIQSASRVAARDSDIARLRIQNADLKDNLAKVTYDLQSANMIDCDPTAPSYRAHVHISRRQWAPIEEAAGTLLPARLLGSKITAREVVKNSAIAVHMPAQLGSWRSVHDVEFDALPDAVVLKLDRSHSSVGVMPLLRVSSDRWLDVIYGVEVTQAQIISSFEQAAARRGASAMFAEEFLIEPERPRSCAIDWKFFCFDGVVGFVMERLTVPRPATGDYDIRMRWWDRDWQYLPALRRETTHDDALPPPRHPRELIETAEGLARLTGRAHIRVDLYDMPDGIYFGEFTTDPGGDWIMPVEQDRRFGQMWEEAESRMLGRLVGSAIRRREIPLAEYLPESATTTLSQG